MCGGPFQAEMGESNELETNLREVWSFTITEKMLNSRHFQQKEKDQVGTENFVNLRFQL